jgi:isoquinoline 1-oxidoreductase subunit alpha
MAVINVNGKALNHNADPRTPLLWVLREQLGLTGTKYGCGIAVCGACTVHVNGQAVRACTTPVSSIAGKKVVTIEGLAADKIGRQVQDAWVENNVPQCGYCQAGQVMAAAALLNAKKNPTDSEIDQAMSGNICRCGCYTRIRSSIKEVAAKRGGAA